MDLELMEKLVSNLGSTGLVIFFGWKLVDRWAGRFLEAQKEQSAAMKTQAAAMGELAESVKDGQGEQHEILLAIRAQASKMDELKGWVRQLAMNGGHPGEHAGG